MAKGIVVSQQGIDISQALDSQKILDSRFRYFDVLQEFVMTMPTLLNDGSQQVIYEHKAGFLPAFDVYDTVLGSYITAADSIGRGLISSKNQLYFNGFYADSGCSSHKVIIRIYNVPITDEFQAPIEQTLPSKGSSPSGQGIKVVRGTTDMNEKELSKFAINTASKVLGIQKTGTTQANSGTNNQFVIQHTLGHPPMFLATYADAAGQWVSGIDFSQILARGVADGVSMTFTGIQTTLIGTLAYIIFKELGDFTI